MSVGSAPEMYMQCAAAQILLIDFSTVTSTAEWLNW